MKVTIDGCFIEFHDLPEVFEFLTHIDFHFLYMFDHAIVRLDGIPFCWLLVNSFDFVYYVTYLRYPLV